MNQHEPLWPTTQRLAEDQIVEGLSRYLSYVDGIPVQVQRRPDRESSGGVDAYLVRGVEGGRQDRIAVEVTMIDPVRNMQRFAKRVIDIKGQLREIMPELFPRTMVSIAIEAERIPKRLAPQDIRSGIIGFLRTVPATGVGHLNYNALGFNVGVSYDHAIGLPIYRFGLQPTTSIADDLPDAMKKAINDNLREKLIPEKRQGSSTVLVLDAREEGFLTELDIGTAFLDVWPSVRNDYLDELWIARSETEGFRFTPLKRGPWVHSGEGTYAEFYNWIMKSIIWNSQDIAHS